MPKISGIELCRAVRDDPELGQPYVVLLTGQDTKKHLVAGMDACADDFISKPFTLKRNSGLTWQHEDKVFVREGRGRTCTIPRFAALAVTLASKSVHRLCATRSRGPRSPARWRRKPLPIAPVSMQALWLSAFAYSLHQSRSGASTTAEHPCIRGGRILSHNGVLPI
jgi:CheY-like chemotaxis protein